MRPFLVLAFVVMLATGCRVGPAAKSGLIAGGIGSTVAGVVLMSQTAVDSDGDGVNENPLNDHLGLGLMGVALFSAGVSMLIGGVAAEATEPAPTSAFVYAPARYTPAVAAPVVAGPPGTTLVVAEPSRTALPELAASEQVVRLAQQVRSAASRGDCAGAWIMWDQLDAVDVTYADAVRSGPILAPCPR